MVGEGLLRTVRMIPVGPLVWMLSWLFRALRSDGKPAAGKARGTRLTVGPAVTVFLYIVFLALPLSFTGMILAGDRIGSAPLTFLAFVLGIYLPFALPHWLAWGVLVPWRWGGGGEGAMVVAGAACQPNWRPGRGRMSPWMTMALALKAEVEEDPERADRLLEG